MIDKRNNNVYTAEARRGDLPIVYVSLPIWKVALLHLRNTRAMFVRAGRRRRVKLRKRNNELKEMEENHQKPTNHLKGQ